MEQFGGSTGWHLGEAGPDELAICHEGRLVGRTRWQLLGEHNRLNALAVVAAARHAGVDPRAAVEALADFRNVKRRMEVKGVAAGVTVYDDFAHHPTAIATTVAGLRQKVGPARILAVLEPRSNTMKLGVMKDQLPASLAAADQVFCFTGGLGWDAAAALAPLGARARCDGDLPALVQAVVSFARTGDHVLVMSNGGFQGVHQKLLEALGAGR